MPPRRLTGFTTSAVRPAFRIAALERGRGVAADVADGAVEVAVQLHVAGHPEHDPAARLDQTGQRAERARVLVDVLEHVDRDHGGDRLAEVGQPGCQVEDPGLDLGPVGEPVGHRGHGLGIDIGHDVSAEPGELGRELPQAGADLEHRRTQVGPQLLELEGPVAALVGTRRSPRDRVRWPGGTPRRPASRRRSPGGVRRGRAVVGGGAGGRRAARAGRTARRRPRRRRPGRPRRPAPPAATRRCPARWSHRSAMPVAMVARTSVVTMITAYGRTS